MSRLTFASVTESSRLPSALVSQPITAASCSSDTLWTSNLSQSVSVRNRQQHLLLWQQNVALGIGMVSWLHQKPLSLVYCSDSQMVLFVLSHANGRRTNKHSSICLSDSFKTERRKTICDYTELQFNCCELPSVHERITFTTVEFCGNLHRICVNLSAHKPVKVHIQSHADRGVLCKHRRV